MGYDHALPTCQELASREVNGGIVVLPCGDLSDLLCLECDLPELGLCFFGRQEVDAFAVGGPDRLIDITLEALGEVPSSMKKRRLRSAS